MNEFKLSAKVIDGIGALMQSLMDNKPIGGVFSLYSQFNAEVQMQIQAHQLEKSNQANAIEKAIDIKKNKKCKEIRK